MNKILVLLLCLCGSLFAGEPTRFYIIRHGQTDWNVEKRVQGHSDIPLNAVGRKEAEQLRGSLHEIVFDACISSDLQRASETARIILQGRSLAIETDARLREGDFGPLEGRLASELNKQDHLTIAKAQAERQPRIFAALDELVEHHPGHTLLLVTHGGVIKNILARFFSATPSFEAHIKNTGLLCIEIEENQWCIKEMQGVEISGSLPQNGPLG